MLSSRGARGVQKAELDGNVDSDNNHGGSSTDVPGRDDQTMDVSICVSLHRRFESELSPECASTKSVQHSTLIIKTWESLRQTCNPWEYIEACVETQNLVDSILFHNREMHCVAGRQLSIS